MLRPITNEVEIEKVIRVYDDIGSNFPAVLCQSCSRPRSFLALEDKEEKVNHLERWTRGAETINNNLIAGLAVA